VLDSGLISNLIIKTMINLPQKKKAQEKANKNGLRALIHKFPVYNVTHTLTWDNASCSDHFDTSNL